MIEALDATVLRARERELVDILVDCVDGGASVGFLPPLATGEAAAYWRGVAGALSDGSRVLLVAGAPGRPADGTVQLDLAMRANGLHRAEVVRLLVHRRARRRGLGRALMLAIEAERGGAIARRWCSTAARSTTSCSTPDRYFWLLV